MSVAIIVVGGGAGAYAVMHKSDDKDASNSANSSGSSSSDSMSGMDNMSQSGSSGSGAASGNSSSQSSGNSSGDTSNAVSADQVKISNYAFSPQAIKIKVGTKVTWTNTDAVGHNIAMDDGADGPSSPILSKGDTYAYTFTKAGTYHYHCTPHPYMKASVVVTE